MVAPGARACDGSARPAVTEATPTVLESSQRRLRLRPLLPTPTFEAHRVGGREYQQSSWPCRRGPTSRSG
jgi:hypothetical protein